MKEIKEKEAVPKTPLSLLPLYLLVNGFTLPAFKVFKNKRPQFIQ